MDGLHPIPELVALIPLTIVPIVVVLIAATAMRQRSQVAVSMLLIVIHVLWAIGFYIPIPAIVSKFITMPAQQAAYASLINSYSATTLGGIQSTTKSTDKSAAEDTAEKTNTITVMTLNCRYGRADAGSITHYVEMNNIDVLALQEVTDDLMQRLEQAGLRQILPSVQRGAKTDGDNGGFNALLTRLDVVSSTGSALPIASSNVSSIITSIGGETVRFASVHPKSPQRSGKDWSSSIQALGSLATESLTTVVMGDLNSNLHHASLRKTLQQGFADSSYELHSGAHNTFPASWPAFPALIEIDHVLHTTGITAVNEKTVKVPRTDHLGLIVTLKTVPSEL